MANDEQVCSKTAQPGLYRPDFEHDACGIGFVANVAGVASRETVERALEVLRRLDHRGGCGCDPETGDGAGILLQVPHELFADLVHERQGLVLEPHSYAVGMLFLSADDARRAEEHAIVERALADEQFAVLAWRAVPVDPSVCGVVARESMPWIEQVVVVRAGSDDSGSFDRKLYVARKRIESAARARWSEDRGLYVCSLSRRTIVYKGLLVAERLGQFYRDLADPRVTTAIALVHSRFSTNTFPSWERAHPYRQIVHNGEFNTIRGNVNWMRARERNFDPLVFGADVATIRPVIDPQGSDSAMFDNAVELLVQAGRTLPEALMMLIPEAWERDEQMCTKRRAFYEYAACKMEPWDGPAAIAFTDGVVVGAVLDRNGLRPARYTVTDDGWVVLASEVGCLDLDPRQVVEQGRVEPGRMFLVDTAQGKVVSDEEIKNAVAEAHPYAEWLSQHRRVIGAKKQGISTTSCVPVPLAEHDLLVAQRRFGYTREDVRTVIRPMACEGKESIGSMGNDTPPAVLSDRPQLLYNYFKQLFAQVTNPPIDSLRERIVMSLRTAIGPMGDIATDQPHDCAQVVVDSPVLGAADFRALTSDSVWGVPAATLDLAFECDRNGAGLAEALAILVGQAERAVLDGARVVVLSDRNAPINLAPIPALLATSAVHHHLIRTGLRTRCSLIVESGEPREVMHFCLLVGYGAAAIYPYLVYEVLRSQQRSGLLAPVTYERACTNYRKAVDDGVLKVMSKMGISTLQSYRGAQVFEALGISSSVVDRYFTWTPTRIGGIGLNEIAAEAATRHHRSREASRSLDPELDIGGVYQWRRRGERHMYNPSTIASLQHAVRSGSYDLFKRFSRAANDHDEGLCTIRGLLDFRSGTPVPIDEVEPVAEIVKRFRTGAMSFGSISKEAHENLAVAMNQIGARSNTGEGGEDAQRFAPDPDGALRRSAIKQIASGRFGVTSHYLVNADELQIKMAQGAKPGEGGQLPGHKVDEVIASVRCSTPGVGLISPPPHHDIYSIEDLAQLIYDLKNANEQARVSVKLVSEVGVGTIAAGVVKAKADAILIAGDSGGTGASPLTSIQHAGAPWELGLAETQQTLVLNGLRSRVRLETDGQLKTGRDVAIACLLGAEEFGFGTAALVASGCILMRVCHLNTCPVGVATQDPELRRRFRGEPEHVINFMYFVAQEFREIMAQLGFRRVDDMVGQVDRLEAKQAIRHYKARGIDLSALLTVPQASRGEAILRCTEGQDHALQTVLDRRLIEVAGPALENQKSVTWTTCIRNTDRSVGTLLSAEVSRRYGAAGLPPGTIKVQLTGSCGQSFGAFLARGIEMVVLGDANDYVGKGLSGGTIAILPPRSVRFVAADSIIVGNVCLYGATGGELYVNGRAGERFAVRNSGAAAVVEGVGDHGCEYMTRGTVVVLGRTGKNFGAGMSGGVAYVWDPERVFGPRCNHESVDVDGLEPGDVERLESLLRRHVEHTGSTVAAQLLTSWPHAAMQFVRVMGREYKRVATLQQAEQREQEVAG